MQNDLIWTPQKDLLFRIKKYKDLTRRILSPKIGIGNFYRLEAFNVEDGRTRWLTDWFHNNITDQGLNLCATNTDRYKACQIGSGNTPPSNADTGLQTFVAGTVSSTWISITNQSSTIPYYVETYLRYNFTTGAVVGNMSEVMIGTAASGGSCFSRELIRDSGGNPTTITVASNEALRVHYKIRHYPPISDVAGVASIYLNGTPTNHATTRRASDIDSQTSWSPTQSTDTPAQLIGSSPSPSVNYLYTGGLGSITAQPSGTSGNSNSHADDSYSQGSFSRTYRTTWSTTLANQTNQCVAFYLSTRLGGARAAGFIQVLMEPSIVKTNLDTLTLEFITNWGRYVP